MVPGDRADSESEGSSGLRGDGADARGLGLPNQSVSYVLRQQLDEMGRRGRTREQDNVNPARLPHEVDVGGRENRVVRVRLDYRCAAIPRERF